MSKNYALLVDGLCRGNGKPDSKCGASLALIAVDDDVVVNDEYIKPSTFDGERKPIHRSDFMDGLTNNECEVLAIIMACNYLNQAAERGLKFDRIELWSDSDDAINWVFGTWKCKKNPRLCEYVDVAKALVSEHPEIVPIHVNNNYVKGILGH